MYLVRFALSTEALKTDIISKCYQNLVSEYIQINPWQKFYAPLLITKNISMKKPKIICSKNCIIYLIDSIIWYI